MIFIAQCGHFWYDFVVIQMFRKILWRATWLVWRPLLEIFCRFKIEGQEHCRGLSGPLIVMVNHAHYFDPYTLSAAMPFKNRIFPIHFLTHVYYMRMPVLGAIIRAYGAIPVEPGVGIERALVEPESVLRRGGVVGFFPEGSLGKEEGKFLPAKPGIAWLGTRTGVPILPVAIRGHAGFTFFRFLLRRAHIAVVFAKPFTLKEISPALSPVSTKQELIEAAELAMVRVKELYANKT